MANLLISIDSMENQTGVSYGVFSREGRVINTKFSELQMSHKSFDSNHSVHEETKNYKIEFEESDKSEDDSIANHIDLKLASPPKRNKKEKLISHPLYGHLSKAKLKEHLSGNLTSFNLHRP